jgi:dihydropteroate synthase
MKRPAIMGIVNITPDSFSGDGALSQAAVAHAEALVIAGADIIDLGAESTRPGAMPLNADDEWTRLGPVLEKIVAHPWRVRTRLSVDTRHAQTAARAIELGVNIINDVSGLVDYAMMELLEEHDCDVVVMHALSVPANANITLPDDRDVVAEIVKWKRSITEKAQSRGIAPERLIYDPGIGFGKTAQQSLLLMQSATTLKASGGRWLYGHSRKSFLKLLGADAARDALTLEWSATLAEAGVDYLRVHDVAAHTAMFDAVCT